MGFHWSLSDSKSPQISRTLLSTLVNLNNAGVWSVSAPNSNAFRPFSINLETVPIAPVIIGITVTLMFYRFFSYLTMSKNLSIFSHLFYFHCAVCNNGKISKTANFLFSFSFLFSFILINTGSDLLTEMRWSVCDSKSQRSLCVSFSRTDSYIYIYWPSE